MRRKEPGDNSKRAIQHAMVDELARQLRPVDLGGSCYFLVYAPPGTGKTALCSQVRSSEGMHRLVACFDTDDWIFANEVRDPAGQPPLIPQTSVMDMVEVLTCKGRSKLNVVVTNLHSIADVWPVSSQLTFVAPLNRIKAPAWLAERRMDADQRQMMIRWQEEARSRSIGYVIEAGPTDIYYIVALLAATWHEMHVIH